MGKEGQKISSITGVTPEQKLFTDHLIISEDNQSIWGFVINSTLKESEGKFGKFRYMSISLGINGRDLQLAQGIWNLQEASKISKRIKNNVPNISDYFEVEDKFDNKIIYSNCNSQVFNYLVFKKAITKDNSNKNGMYKIFYPHLFGEDISPLDINIYPSNSNKKGYTQLEIHISSKSKEELVK